MKEICLDFGGGDLVGAAAIVPSESGDGTQVGSHGAFGESAKEARRFGWR